MAGTAARVAVERCGKQPRYNTYRWHCSIICLIELVNGPFPVTNSKNLLIGWILSQKFPMASGLNGSPECVSAVKASS
jgi:hypothetical protein